MSREISMALRNLSRTRQLLTLLITSSESFDYRAAKDALSELQIMIRELSREEARLRVEAKIEAQRISAANPNILPFPQPSSVQRP